MPGARRGTDNPPRIPFGRGQATRGAIALKCLEDPAEIPPPESGGNAAGGRSGYSSG